MSRLGHAERQQGSDADDAADGQEDWFEADDVDQHPDQWRKDKRHGEAQTHRADVASVLCGVGELQRVIDKRFHCHRDQTQEDEGQPEAFVTFDDKVADQKHRDQRRQRAEENLDANRQPISVSIGDDTGQPAEDSDGAVLSNHPQHQMKAFFSFRKVASPKCLEVRKQKLHGDKQHRHDGGSAESTVVANDLPRVRHGLFRAASGRRALVVGRFSNWQRQQASQHEPGSGKTEDQHVTTAG